MPFGGGSGAGPRFSLVGRNPVSDTFETVFDDPDWPSWVVEDCAACSPWRQPAKRRIAVMLNTTLAVRKPESMYLLVNIV